jgi:hypothetical protein
VPQGVLDEVAQRLFHPKAIDANIYVWRIDFKPAARISGAPIEPGRDAFEQLVEGDFVEAQRQPSLVGAREKQEVRRELGQPVGFDPHLAERCLELRSRARGLERQLDFRLEVCKRRSELMTRVRDEASFALQRGLETGKHLVERVAQPGNLVP